MNIDAAQNSSGRIAIVGAGAAGLMAAAQLSLAGLCCDIFEAQPKIGKSILITGNGRCNISHAKVSAQDYRHSLWVAKIFDQIPASEVMRRWSALGLVTTEDISGRLYPFSNKASSVLEVLELACKPALSRQDLRIICNAEVQGISVKDGAYVLEVCERKIPQADPSAPKPKGHAAKKRAERALLAQAQLLNTSFGPYEQVIVAVGGKISAALLPECLCKPCHERLCPLELEASVQGLIAPLDNQRTKAQVSLVDAQGVFKAQELGEVQWKPWGLSGICIFNLSRFYEPGDFVCIDLTQGRDFSAYINQLCERFEDRSISELLKGIVGLDVAQVIEHMYQRLFMDGDYSFVDPATALNLSQLQTADLGRQLQCLLSCLSLPCASLRPERLAQVHRGGVDPIDLTDQLELSHYPGIYVVGEAVDVDGPCGGYNLHWAWASASCVADELIRKKIHA